MTQISAGKLDALLAAGTASTIFFLHGEEAHLRDHAERRIVAAYLDPSTRDFNFDQLRGSDVAAETLASMLGTPPLMAEHRVVVVRDAQGLSAKAREAVELAAASPPRGLVLVLSAQIPSGSKAKFYSTLQKLATSIEFSPVPAVDLPGWLVEHARDSHALELDLDAARALVTSVGGQLGILASEVGKLAAYLDGRSHATLADVRAVGGSIPRVDRFAWFDLVCEKRFAEALQDLPDLLGTETGVGVIIGLSSQMVRIGLGVAGGREGLERELKGYQRWMASKVATAARHWSATEVDIALEEMLRTDRLLKSAPLTDRQAIEELLLRLAERVGTRRRAA